MIWPGIGLHAPMTVLGGSGGGMSIGPAGVSFNPVLMTVGASDSPASAVGGATAVRVSISTTTTTSGLNRMLALSDPDEVRRSIFPSDGLCARRGADSARRQKKVSSGKAREGRSTVTGLGRRRGHLLQKQ